jgi:ribosomal protein S6
MTNNMARYEVLFVTIPSLTSDESNTIESQFHELVSTNKGKALSYDKWGKYRLAYEMKKNEYGNYFLSRFEIPSAETAKVLEQLRNFFAVKYSDSVMRHLVTRLNPTASLEYKRPESMEEAPSRAAREEGRRGEDGFERRRTAGKGRRTEEAIEASEMDDAITETI